MWLTEHAALESRGLPGTFQSPILVRSHIVLLGTSEVLEKGVPVNALWLPHRIRKPWGWGLPLSSVVFIQGVPTSSLLLPSYVPFR